jgi:hypothetical protein
MKEKVSKVTGKKRTEFSSVRVSVTAKERADSLLLTINKKKFGRKVKFDDLFELAIGLVAEEHCKMLGERSLTNEDRKEQLRQRYIEQCGPISKDAWTGFTMTKEFHEFLKEHEAGKSATSRVAEVAILAG